MDHDPPRGNDLAKRQGQQAMTMPDELEKGWQIYQGSQPSAAEMAEAKKLSRRLLRLLGQRWTDAIATADKIVIRKGTIQPNSAFIGEMADILKSTARRAAWRERQKMQKMRTKK
jgi:hypothetical protein